MNPVGSVTSYQSNALTLLQSDASLKPRSAQAEAEADLDPTTLAAAAALQVLDPRPALRLSSQAADAILSVLHGSPHQRNSVGSPAGIDESALLSDDAFAKTVGNTPTQDIELMNAMGAARWVWRPEVHRTDTAYFKALSLAIPYDDLLRDSMRTAIFERNSAKVISSADVPEAKIVSGYYDMYDDRNSFIGTVRKTTCDAGYLRTFEKNNPGMLIAPVYFGNDAVLVIWPKLSARTD